MYYFMEAFKKVDIIVTPTTGYPFFGPSGHNINSDQWIFLGLSFLFVLLGQLHQKYHQVL
jgi:hypothetical protein